MSRSVIVSAVRTPFGKLNGGLSGMHSIDLLAIALRRADGEHALETMCSGGGLGTGTLLRRG